MLGEATPVPFNDGDEWGSLSLIADIRALREENAKYLIFMNGCDLVTKLAVFQKIKPELKALAATKEPK